MLKSQQKKKLSFKYKKGWCILLSTSNRKKINCIQPILNVFFSFNNDYELLSDDLNNSYTIYQGHYSNEMFSFYNKRYTSVFLKIILL